MMNRLKIINKGADRHLYDQDKNKRITLNEIRRMIVAGTDLRFVEEHSGDDITVAMLVHIITEKEQAINRASDAVLTA